MYKLQKLLKEYAIAVLVVLGFITVFLWLDNILWIASQCEEVL